MIRLTAVLALAAVGIAPRAPKAATIITGVIREATTNTPIAGAVVRLNNGRDSAVTDAQGRYRLRNPDRDETSLFVSHPRYLSVGAPRLTVRTDTLQFSAELRTDLKPRDGSPLIPPVVLVRLSADTVIATFNSREYFGALTGAAANPDIESLDVVKPRQGFILGYGDAAQGGVIRVLMSRAAAFPFAALPPR